MNGGANSFFVTNRLALCILKLTNELESIVEERALVRVHRLPLRCHCAVGKYLPTFCPRG